MNINRKYSLLTSLIGLLFLLSCENISQRVFQDENEKVLLDTLESLYKQGKQKECVEKGEVFTSIYPNNANGWHLLGSAYLSLKEDSLATIRLSKALQINPQHSAALVNMGTLLDKKGKFEEAKGYYHKAIEIDPYLAQAYSNFAVNRLRANDFKLAIMYGEKAVELANQISDKGILCLSYHKAGMFKERDNLLYELESLHYPNIANLKEIFKN